MTMLKIMQLSRAFQRQFSSSKFSHTSVFMQTGLKIRELPLVVKKVNDVLSLDEPRSPVTSSASVPIVFVDKAMSDLMENMNRFVSVDSLFKFLETIPAEKVTPPVAVHALKRIIHLNNLSNCGRNQIKSGSFLRFAFINMLLDIVYRSKDPRCILDGLRVVCQDDFSEERQQIAQYKERMYEETVMLMTDGLFSITQICEAVVILSRFYANDRARSQELADSLWTGIVDKAENKEELDIKTAIHMFKILPYLTKSRDMIYKMVSNKVCDDWKRLGTKDVLEILRIVNSLGRVQCNRCQHSTLSMISQWLSVNIHTLSEAELLAVIVCMDKMEFLDDKLIQTTERFMKVAAMKVKEADLIGKVIDFCLLLFIIKHIFS